MLWVCEGCGTRYAESLEACPQCGGGERHAAHEAAPAADGGEDEEADEVPKITTHGGATFPQDHPGASAQMEAVEHPADGTLSPPVDNGGGPVQAAVTVLPPEPEAVPEPPAAAAEPPAAPAPKKPAPSLSKAKAGE